MEMGQKKLRKLILFVFEQNHHHHCLFYLSSNDTYMALLLYVDDVLITKNDIGKISEVLITS